MSKLPTVLSIIEEIDKVPTVAAIVAKMTVADAIVTGTSKEHCELMGRIDAYLEKTKLD